jgi:hypothetical protein
MVGITSGVFFRRFASSARTAPTPTQDLLVDQFAAPLGHGVGVQTEQIGDQAVIVVSQGLKARKQASLLFVQQGIEQENSSFDNVGVGV